MAHKKVTQKPKHERLQILLSSEAAQRLAIASALSRISRGHIITQLIFNALPPASQALSEADHSSNA